MFFLIYLICCFLLFDFSTANQSSYCGDWTPYLDLKCFTLIDEFHNYEDAVKACRKKDQSAVLLTIHSAEENAFISNTFFKTHAITESIWIGAKAESVANKKQFKWSDQSPLNYTNWAPENPKNSTTASCVQMISEQGLHLGTWADEPCTKRNNLVACQKPQLWPIELLHEKLLQTREEMKKFLHDSVEEEKRTLASLKTELQNEINELKSNPLPAGFIYVQLSGQPEPKSLWPMLKWAEVTGQYAGNFFRAEGGGSAPFGQAQSENAPRLAEFKMINGPYENFKWSAMCNPGEWSPFIFTGNGGGENKDGVSARLTGGEVRPKNKAIKVWKRV